MKAIQAVRFILRIFVAIVRQIFRFYMEFIERLLGRGDRDIREECCAHFPPAARARPDPYVYSQFWLWLRQIGFVWNNPDFTLIDTVNNKAVNSYDLEAAHIYRIDVQIHNGSYMAALATTVAFEILEFGAGGVTTQMLPSAIVDVPGGGSATASTEWKTPAVTGHNCIRATISHPDDANPWNNVGQHNTDVTRAASPTQQAAFIVRNSTGEARNYRLEMNAYQLPKEPMRPRLEAERRSLAYLERLRAINDPANFPVPQGAHLSHAELVLKADETREVVLTIDPAAVTVPININVFEGDRLLGGITAIPQGA